VGRSTNLRGEAERDARVANLILEVRVRPTAAGSVLTASGGVVVHV